MYLEERGGEVVDIMTALFDQDYVTAVHVQSEVTKAVDKVTKEKDAEIDKVTKEKDAEINKAAKEKEILLAEIASLKLALASKK